MASIRKKPSGNYEARYRDPTGRMLGKTFRTKREAQDFLDRTGTAIGDGSWRDPALAKVRLSEYTTWWLENRPELRPRTRELYSGLLRLHIEPHLGDCRFGSLTTAEVRAWHAALLRKGKPGPVTVAKAYRLLRCILNDAVEDGLLARNPCTIRGAGVERSPERPVASIAEVYHLADAMEDRYRLMVLLATFGGLRLGELLALRRDRVDVLHRRVIVTEQLQERSDGTRHYGPPKTAAGVRTVALPPHLVAEVEDHLFRWVGPAPSDLLFTGPNSPALYRATFNAAWDRARRSGRDGGLPLPRSPPHGEHAGCRHRGEHEGADGSHGPLPAPGPPCSTSTHRIERDVVIAERLSAMTEEALGQSEGTEERADAGLRQPKQTGESGGDTTPGGQCVVCLWSVAPHDVDLVTLNDASRPRSPGDFVRERPTRIELASSAWKAEVLPLNYGRESGDSLKPLLSTPWTHCTSGSAASRSSSTWSIASIWVSPAIPCCARCIPTISPSRRATSRCS